MTYEQIKPFVNKSVKIRTAYGSKYRGILRRKDDSFYVEGETLSMEFYPHHVQTCQSNVPTYEIEILEFNQSGE